MIGRTIRWALAFGFFLAAGIVYYKGNEITFVREFRHKIASTRYQANAPTRIETVFLPLDVARHDVPVSREGAGGGVTAVNGTPVVMPHDGKVFALIGDEIVPLAIELPDNGFDALKARAATDAYKGYVFSFFYMRYNDILWYEDGDRRGFVASFTEWDDAQECYGTTVAHLPLAAPVADLAALQAAAADWQIAYRTQPCLKVKRTGRAIEGHMAGGRLAYRGGGKVVLSNGDYALDGTYAPIKVARDPAYDYGKVIEIDLAAQTGRQIDRDALHVGMPAVDALGRIWTLEHGRRGGDELNLIREGGDYGWPDAGLGTKYNKLPLPITNAYGSHDGFDLPVYAWLPSVAVSGLTTLNDMHPAWAGDLMAGTLKALSLFRIRIRQSRILFAEHIPVGARVRALVQHAPGKLALWTDQRSLMILTVDPAGYSGGRAQQVIAALDLPDETRTRVAEAVDACSECHSLGADATDGAPALGGVFGRGIATSRFDGYSGALRAKGGTWDADTLTAFLDAPDAFAPGTGMPDPGLDDPAVTAGVVEVLRRLARDAE